MVDQLGLRATNTPPRVTDAGAAGRASAFPQIRQAAGIQMAAQNAGQPSVVPVALSLKGLAHADTAFVKETIGRITQDLAQHVTREKKGIGSSSAIAQHLVNEGVELQRSADFADQGKAKIWTLRVLSWIGSVITLGALPGLTKLLAPESDFAGSLSRYLLGNGPEVGKDKLEKFDQLFKEFQGLNTLTTRNAELEQKLEEAKKLLPSYENVQEQLQEGISRLSSMALGNVPESIQPGTTRCQNYRQGLKICQDYFWVHPMEIGGINVKTLDGLVSCLVEKSSDLPNDIDASTRSTIQAELQALSTELDNLDKIMCDWEGVRFRTMSPADNSPVERQVINVRQHIQSLAGTFEGGRGRRLPGAQEKIVAIEGQQATNKTAIADASSSIRSSILELGPERKIPETSKQGLLKVMNLHLRGKKLDQDGKEVDRGNTFKHYKIDWNTAITEDIFNQENPVFPEGCCFERDFFRNPFTLTIGGKTLESLGKGGDAFKQQTRKFVLGQITQLAEANGLNRVDVLRNFLRTYTGQDVTNDFLNVFRDSSEDAFKHYHISMTDHMPVTLQIGDDGSCTVSHSLERREVGYTLTLEEVSSDFNVPCDIHLGVSYTSSLGDFTSGLPPHAIEDRCAASGRCLDVSAMM